MTDNAVTLFYSPCNIMIWLYQRRKRETLPDLSVVCLYIQQSGRLGFGWQMWFFLYKPMESGRTGLRILRLETQISIDQHLYARTGAYLLTWESFVPGSCNNCNSEFLCSRLCSDHGGAPAKSQKSECRIAFLCLGTCGGTHRHNQNKGKKKVRES